MDYIVCKTQPEAKEIKQASLCLLCEFAEKCDKDLAVSSDDQSIGFIVMPEDFFEQDADKAVIFGEACLVNETKHELTILPKKYFCRVCKPFSVILNGTTYSNTSLNVPTLKLVASINQEYVYWEDEEE